MKMLTNFDYTRALFTEENSIWFGFTLEGVNDNNLVVRMDASSELHRMPVAYDYFEGAMREARELHCEHVGQNFNATVTELVTVDKANEILRLRLTATITTTV
jgi:hypothetical protein